MVTLNERRLFYVRNNCGQTWRRQVCTHTHTHTHTREEGIAI